MSMAFGFLVCCFQCVSILIFTKHFLTIVYYIHHLLWIFYHFIFGLQIENCFTKLLKIWTFLGSLEGGFVIKENE